VQGPTTVSVDDEHLLRRRGGGGDLQRGARAAGSSTIASRRVSADWPGYPEFWVQV